MELARIISDLADEHASLQSVVDTLGDDSWHTPTRCAGWSIADQLAHLAFFDRTAVQAIQDPESFALHVAEVAGVFEKGQAAMDEATIGPYRQRPREVVTEDWSAGAAALNAAASTLDQDARILWYGPPMGAKSFLSARLMETWTHGEDIVDALQRSRPPTDRIRHVVQLGVITRAWSYQQRGQTVPDEPVHVVLEAPSGATWEFGPTEATERVTGVAEDFCLVVTQRRHLDDTELTATPIARDWLLKAQAFAGPATEGPAPTA